jgi:hypothetical protein
LRLEATLDRTSATPRDRVVLSIPKMPQPERLLGKADEVALAIPAGDLLVWAELTIEGETLKGRMLVEQRGISLTARLSPKFGAHWNERVAKSLGEVNKLQAEVRLTGTLDKPSWKLRSNLGPEVATSMTAALQAGLNARQGELCQTLDQYLAVVQSQFDDCLAGSRQKVLDQIRLAANEMDSARRLAGNNKPVERTSTELPIKNPFSRR